MKNPEEALRGQDEGKFQLVITDLFIPEMPRIEFINRVYEINSEVPIIVATGVLEDVRGRFLSVESFRLFLTWLREHQLGRKRLFDTQLATTYFCSDVRSIVSSNIKDFEVVRP